jgi:tetratricopeptide (TPR) repeat protein
VSDAATSYARTYVDQGIALFQQGRLDEAAAAFAQALQWQPGCADALNGLGTVRMTQGRWQEAMGCYEEILRREPGYASAHYNLGVVLHQAGRLGEAAACYERTLALVPGAVDAWNNLGNVRQARGDREGAVTAFEQALRCQPDSVAAYNNLGLVLAEVGRRDEAAACYRQALALQPQLVAAHVNLGDVLLAQGRLDEAAACFQEAIRLQPELAEAHNRLGLVRVQQERFAEASACHRQALALKPDYADAHNNLGSALFRQRRTDEALASCQQALQIQPDFAQAHCNLGSFLAYQGRFEEAVRSYEQAVRIKPDFAEAYHGLGIALARQGRFEEAMASQEEALRLRPGFADAHYSRGLALLLQGDFEHGWPEYEWRWQRPGHEPRVFAAPLWDGTPLQGRTILLHAEQGLGDTIQFLRYAPLVQERGGTVVVECQPALLALAATCPGIEQLLPQGAPLPAFEVHAPLLSLPSILGTTLAHVPADIPYLRARPDLIEQWRRQLDEPGTFNVGIAWQGNPAFPQDHLRSFPLKELAPLGRLPGVRLISLQKVHGREQLADLGGLFPVLDLGERIDEAAGPFMDTAAIMLNLDLMVTSDTSIAHLAGALGVRVWIALEAVPEWRWLLDRPDSPWYPTARLFRQPEAGNWGPVFEQMASALQKLLGA